MPGYVTVPAFDANGETRNIIFWSSDGTVDGDLVAAQQPQQFAPVLPEPFPASIAAGDTYESGLVGAAGFSVVAVGVTLSQVGSLTIRRYLDAAGEVLAAAETVQALAAGTPAVVQISDGKVFAALEILVTNSAGAAGAVTGTAVLLGN